MLFLFVESAIVGDPTMADMRTINLPRIPVGPSGPPKQTPSPQVPPPPQHAPFFRAAPVRAPSAAAHPLIAPMYWACADLLATASDLAAAKGGLPSADELRSAIDRQLMVMMERARSAGILMEDIVDAQYAIVALVDELLARVHGWGGNAEWRRRPLQLIRFNENTAGENFFRRLGVLETQPHRVHVMQIYFLCMAVGFQGRYFFGGGDSLLALYDRIGARVTEAAGPDVISPHGEPSDRRGLFQLEAPLVRIGLGIFAFALFCFIAMRLTLSVQVRGAIKPMQDFASSTLSGSKH